MRPFVANPAADESCRQLGHAHVTLTKRAGDAVKTDALSGRLYFSSSGWLLLSVPNALGQGAFDALDEAGAELPAGSNGRYNAHITVMRPEEVAAAGGPDKITERGHSYRYSLGPVKEVVPDGQTELSKVWYIQVDSPELKELRRTYGLTPLPNDNKYDFHITFAQRKKNVLKSNPVSKAASFEEENAAAKEKAKSSPMGHIRDGYIPCPGCGTRYWAMPSDSKCPGCGTKMHIRLRSAKLAADRPVPDDWNHPADREDCPHCGAMHERGDGYCNSCGKRWPAATKKAEAAADSLLLLMATTPAARLAELLGVPIA